jgi:predicted MFS family arabinose efflux permease
MSSAIGADDTFRAMEAGARAVSRPLHRRRWRRHGLLLHRDFLALWAGETISYFGSRITDLALPLTAVLLLGASEEQMGIYGAIQNVPFLLIGLLAGVWVDRFRRRPLLIAVNLADAILVLSIPFAYWLGVLSMTQLYLIAFGTGMSSVIAFAGYQAYIPTLVGRRHLVDANAKLEISASLATVIGPSLGGVLVQLLTAPIAMLVDALSFLAAVFGLTVIRRPEPAPPPRHERAPILVDIREGLAVITRDPRLRLITLAGASWNFFANGMLAALYVLYLAREIELSPAQIGVVFAATGVGALLGALLVGKLPRWIGVGPTIAHSQLISSFSWVLVALAAVVNPDVALAVLVTGEVVRGLSRTVFNVTQVSLRQAVTPDRLLGRMNASMRFLMWCATPLGAIFGGLLAGAIGLPETIALGAAGTFIAAIWVYLPPVWQVREQPTQLR